MTENEMQEAGISGVAISNEAMGTSNANNTSQQPVSLEDSSNTMMSNSNEQPYSAMPQKLMSLDKARSASMRPQSLTASIRKSLMNFTNLGTFFNSD